MFAISDTGTGMSREVVARVRAFLQQGRRSRHRLGLSWIYGLSSNQMATKVYSELNMGTTVEIHLPRIHSNETANIDAKLNGMLDARAGPARILAVEDEVLLQMLLIDTLEEAGFKVDAVGSATDAIDKIRSIPGGADAAIVDIGLPDRRGDILVRELRTIYPGLPVIVTSGRDSRELRARFEDQPKIIVIGKPYDPNDLIAALKSVGISGDPAAERR